MGDDVISSYVAAGCGYADISQCVAGRVYGGRNGRRVYEYLRRITERGLTGKKSAEFAPESSYVISWSPLSCKAGTCVSEHCLWFDCQVLAKENGIRVSAVLGEMRKRHCYVSVGHPLYGRASLSISYGEGPPSLQAHLHQTKQASLLHLQPYKCGVV